jgi:recombination protein RecA
VKVVKNKVAAPFKQAEFDILFNEGISKSGDMLDLAVKRNIITNSGAFYTYKVTKIGQGRESARLAIKSNAKLMSEIEKALNEEPVVTITAKGKAEAKEEETVEAEA